MKKNEYCVYIGRFSPFHLAHKALLEKAFEAANKVIVVIGSCKTPRTIKNPWSDIERQKIITDCLTPEQKENTIFVLMRDYLYNDNLWVSNLQQKVSEATDFSESVSLIGFESDETSFYLKMFPQYQYIPHDPKIDFHATKIRDLYFSYDLSYKSMVPVGVSNFLEEFKKTKFFTELKQEKDYIDQYKEKWRGSPFPPIFSTVDAVVIKSGHVLVVSRKFNPGKGLLALPGGFVNQKEKLQDAVLRELKEETGIKINIGDLRKMITGNRVFDDPFRSLRGRTITHAYLFDLGVGILPQVKAADDADSVQWLPLSDFYAMSNEFFDDHWHIINHFSSKF